MADDTPCDIRNGDSLKFLHGISSRDGEQRDHAVETIRKKLDDWIEGYGSPDELYLVQNNHGGKSLGADFSNLVQEHLPDIIRLTETCPFGDVSKNLKGLLKDFQVCRHWVQAFSLQAFGLTQKPRFASLHQPCCQNVILRTILQNNFGPQGERTKVGSQLR